jgi:hypothetical protein
MSTPPVLKITTAPTPVRHTLAVDVYLGVMRGDFAPEMGGAGRLAQVICGFIPIVGSVCAIRDLIADYMQRDFLGVTLNGLAVIPFIGGFSKIAVVARSIRRTGRIVRAARMMTQDVPTNQPPISPLK